MGFQYSGGGTFKKILVPPFEVEASYLKAQGSGMNWGEQQVTYLLSAHIMGETHDGNWRYEASRAECENFQFTAKDILGWQWHCYGDGTDEAFFRARGIVYNDPRVASPFPVESYEDAVALDKLIEPRHRSYRESSRYGWEMTHKKFSK